MATTIVPPTINDDTSMSDLRAMLGGDTKAAPATTGATTETSETVDPEVDPAEEIIQTATEPVEEKPVPETKDELPEGVKKRTAKEDAKTAEIQREIDAAVSRRKAKEAELAKLTEGEKGSEPVNTPQSQSGRPKRPQLGEKGHESESYDQFLAREEKFDGEELPAWIEAETLRKFDERAATKEAQKAATAKWDAAVAKHGKDFPALMDSARALAPDGLQVAISALDGWDTVAVHLAKNPAQLKELAQAFQQNPTKAIATLGRIEASLTSKESKPATAEKPLPEPIKKVGGSASASGQDFQDLMENGSIAQLRARLKKTK